MHPYSSAENNFRLPQYFDEETRLHYNYHRYYDPNTGRYLRPDPSHSIQPEGTRIPNLIPSLFTTPQELNLYLYTENNPVNRIDPTALRWVFIGWKVEKQTSWRAIYRRLIARCKNDCGHIAVEEIEEVEVLNQQWWIVPINVKPVRGINSLPQPAGADEVIDNAFDLFQAILEAKRYGGSKYETIRSESGQKYCDQLPTKPCRYSICED